MNAPFFFGPHPPRPRIAVPGAPRAPRGRRINALMKNLPNIQTISNGCDYILAAVHKHYKLNLTITRRYPFNRPPAEQFLNVRNLGFSPLGGHLALSLLRSGSTDQTSRELSRCGQYSVMTKADIELAYREIFRGLAPEEATMYNPRPDLKPELIFINHLYIPLRFNNVNPQFITSVREAYETEVRMVDLKNTHSVQQINDEFRRITEGNIGTALDVGKFNNAEIYGDRIGMVMLNVLYFRGLWEGHNAFDPAETKLLPFTKLNGSKIQVPMMRRKRMSTSYSYYLAPRLNGRGSDKCRAVALYFEGGRYCLVVLLPTKRFHNQNPEDSITAMEAHIEKFSITKIASSFVRYHKSRGQAHGGILADVILPKFRVTADTSVGNVFKQLNAQSAFDSTKAEFTNIHPTLADSDEQLYVTDCVQKVVVDIDENSAPRDMDMSNRLESQRPGVKVKQFLVNRPFVFSIYDYINNVSIAHGSVYNPLETADITRRL